MCEALAGYRVIARQRHDYVPQGAMRHATPQLRWSCREHLAETIDRVFADTSYPTVVTSTAEWRECEWER